MLNIDGHYDAVQRLRLDSTTMPLSTDQMRNIDNLMHAGGLNRGDSKGFIIFGGVSLDEEERYCSYELVW